MATMELLLPSSPLHSGTPRFAQRQCTHIRSSPSFQLPSPSHVLTSKISGPQQGPKEAQILDGVPTRLTSAAALFKDNQHSDFAHERGDRKPGSFEESWKLELGNLRSRKAPAKAAKRAKTLPMEKKNPEGTLNESKGSKSNKDLEVDLKRPTGDVSVIEIPETPPLAAQPARSLPTPSSVPSPAPSRKRPSKKDAEKQTRIKKGRITKPKVDGKGLKQAGDGSKENAKSRSTGVVSEHFRQHDNQSSFEVTQQSSKENDRNVSAENGIAKDEPLFLSKACARRTDWTPPKVSQVALQDSEIISPLTDQIKDGKNYGHMKEPFPALVGNFNYNATPSESASASPEKSPRLPSGEAFSKKRRVDVSLVLS